MVQTLRKLPAIALATCIGFAANAAESVPFNSPLTTQADFDRWTAVDVDGNVEGEKATWYLGSLDMGGTCATSWIDAAGHLPSDHLLVSPAISLEQGVNYAIKFSYYTAYYDDEDLAVYLSKTPELTEDAEPLEHMTALRDYYGGKKTILVPALDEGGDYYVILRHVSDGVKGMVIGIKDFTLATVQEGAAQGHVSTYVNGSAVPLEGVKVIYTGPNVYTAISDAEGYYHIDNMTAADYSVNYEKHGYESASYPYTVTVEPMETATYDISIYKMRTTNVKGKVLDNAGTAISGARVSLTGYENYSGTTGADGSYSLPDVLLNGGYNKSDYVLEVQKNGFADFSKNLGISTYYNDYDAGTAAMSYKPLAPAAIGAEQNGSTVAVTWEAPQDITSLIFDNGTPGRPSGYDNGTEYNVVGTVIRTPMDLKKISWYRMSSDYALDPPENVILYIIGLDGEGNPNPQDFLYTNLSVPSAVNDWTEFELPATVSAPNGCMVALSCMGYVSLAIDDSEEAAPARTQCYSTSYNGGYTFFEDVNWKGAYMLRTEGCVIEDGNFTPDVSYNLYRYEESQKNTPAQWTTLAEKTAGHAFTDSGFGSLERGSYRYAVEAFYNVDNLTSEKVISGPLHKDQHTLLTLDVTADSDPADAEGAVMTLSDGDGHDYSATVADGKAEFSNIWKAAYNVDAKHDGFTLETTTLDLSTDDFYTKSLELKQIIRPVRNIDIVSENGTNTLVWDIFGDIFDDFEGEDHTDFTINPAGAAGWSYVDNDLFRTYGFGATQFPGMGSPMAAILFNSETTVPELGVNPAYSGKRFLAFFAAYPTETEAGMILNTSDDYLISPRLDFHKDFTLSFRAKTYDAQEGRLERVRVGYSTTTPELESFTYVTDGYIGIPEGDPELYTFNIPAEARYVTLNSSSDDVFMLAVDDVKLSSGIPHSGEPDGVGHFLGYNVYVDGNLIATPTANTLQLPDLASGQHTAEVSKLYKGGESQRLAVTFSTGSGIVGITTVSGTDEAEYYNLQGLKVNNPQRGQILIRRQGSKAEKVIIR